MKRQGEAAQALGRAGQAQRRQGRDAYNGPSQGRGRSIEDLLAKELLGVCMAALCGYGANSRWLSEAVSHVRPANGRTPVAEGLIHDVHWLGELATEWAESPSYVDESGRPRTLAISGMGTTFASLVSKYFGEGRLSEILELACRTRVIERVGADKVAQLNTCVMLTGDSVLILARAILSVRRLLAAAKNNAHKGLAKFEFWPEREAHALVPEGCFAEFADVMRPQIANLIEMSNRWLMKHAVSPGAGSTRTKKKLIGVHAYVFRE